MFHYADIVDRLRRGEKREHIKKALGVSPQTISTVRTVAVLNGWLDDVVTPPAADVIDATVAAYKRRRAEQRGQTPPQESPLEAHRDRVTAWVAKGMQAKTIWEALTGNHEYAGSYSSVRRFIRKLNTQSDPIVRLQFGPGELAQVDFGSGPLLVDSSTGKERRTHVFVMTLACSRHQYAEIVWDQSVSTWLRCHRNAFEFFGGVPHKVRIDNLKAAVTKACRHDPQIQRSYGEFAKAYDFIIEPCIVRTPEHKGRVEAGVKYVKGSFLNSPRVFRGINNANQQLLEWVLSEAGSRIHGTTRRQPLQAFAEEEKAALKPLPAERVEIAVWSTVKLHPDCHINFNKAYYSAPHRYIGRELDLRATDSCLMLFENNEMVAFHARAKRAGEWKTNYNHYPPEKVAFLQQTPQWCLQQAEQVGEDCYDFMVQLLGDQVTDRLRAAQGTLRLRKRYGAKRLEAACRRALAFDNIRYGTLKTILKQGLDQVPFEQGAGGQLDLPFVDSPRFARDIAELFKEP